MGLAAGISLIISGFIFALGGEGFSSYFQGQFSYNGCGNTIGTALLNSGNNACMNLQHALNGSHIGLVIGFLMLVGGVMAVSVSISRRKIKRERLSSYTSLVLGLGWWHDFLGPFLTSSVGKKMRLHYSSY